MCGGGDGGDGGDCGGANKNITSPKFSNFGDIIIHTHEIIIRGHEIFFVIILGTHGDGLLFRAQIIIS